MKERELSKAMIPDSKFAIFSPGTDPSNFEISCNPRRTSGSTWILVASVFTQSKIVSKQSYQGGV